MKKAIILSALATIAVACSSGEGSYVNADGEGIEATQAQVAVAVTEAKNRRLTGEERKAAMDDRRRQALQQKANAGGQLTKGEKRFLEEKSSMSEKQWKMRADERAAEMKLRRENARVAYDKGLNDENIQVIEERVAPTQREVRR